MASVPLLLRVSTHIHCPRSNKTKCQKLHNDLDGVGDKVNTSGSPDVLLLGEVFSRVLLRLHANDRLESDIDQSIVDLSLSGRRCKGEVVCDL